MVRESALKADWEKNPLPLRGFKPVSVLRLTFQLDVVPAKLSLFCPGGLNKGDRQQKHRSNTTIV